MTTVAEELLTEHARQEPRAATAANIVRAMLADFARIDALEYVPAKAVRLKQERRGHAEAELVAELRQLEENVDRAIEAEVAAALETARTRLREHPEPVVDVHRTTIARTGPEVAAVLRDAETIGPAELRRVWPYAKARLEELERKEFHGTQLLGASSASSVKVRWADRVTGAAPAAPDATEIRERGQRDKAALRSRVLLIAEVGGLTGAVLRASVRAAVPAPPPDDKLVIGRFWRLHPELINRNG